MKGQTVWGLGRPGDTVISACDIAALCLENSVRDGRSTDAEETTYATRHLVRCSLVKKPEEGGNKMGKLLTGAEVAGTHAFGPCV